MKMLSPRFVWIAILILALPSVILGWTELRYEAAYWYGWLPVTAMFACAVITAQRWDRKWLPPQGWMAYTLLTLAGVDLLVGAILRLPTLASTAFPFACLAFLITHCEKSTSTRADDATAKRVGQAKSLAYCAAPLILLILIPQSLLAWISSKAAILASKMISGWLAILEIPSATVGQTIVLFDSAFETQHVISGAFSWPLLMAIALSYSAWVRLPLLGCALNIVLAWSLAILMVAGSSVTVAYWENNYGAITTSSISAIQIAWLLFVCLVFMSLQRISHAVTAPISSRFMSPQANPFVTAWNLIAGSGRPTRRSGQPAGVSWTFPLIAIGTLLAGAVVQAANLPARAIANPMTIAIDQDALSKLLNRPVHIEQPLASSVGNHTFSLQRATALHPQGPLSLTIFMGDVDSETAIRNVLPSVGKIEKAEAREAVDCCLVAIPGKTSLACVMHAYLDDAGKMIGNANDQGLSAQHMSAQLVIYSGADESPNWGQLSEWFTDLVDEAVVSAKPPTEPIQ